MVKVVITSSYFLELGIKHNWLVSVTPYDRSRKHREMAKDGEGHDVPGDKAAFA